MPLVNTTPYSVLNFPPDGRDNFSEAVYLGFTRYNDTGMSQALGGVIDNGGNYVYFADNNGDRLWRHQLATPYDGTTIIKDGTWRLGIGGTDNQIYDMKWKPDGTRFYVSGNQNKDIYQWDAATNWDMSGASYAGNFDFSPERPRSMWFKDGNTFYVVDNETTLLLYECSMSSAWDITSASLTGTSTDIFDTTGMTNCVAINFRSNGKMLFAVGRGENRIYQFTLDTAWDITTLTYTGTRITVPSSSGEELAAVGFNTNGTRMEVMSNAGFRSFDIPLPS